MIQEIAALELAEEFVRKDFPREDIVAIPDKTYKRDPILLVRCQPRIYLETGNLRRMIIGLRPVFVNLITGAIRYVDWEDNLKGFVPHPLIRPDGGNDI